MKQTLYLLTLTLGLFSCKDQNEKSLDKTSVPKTIADEIKLHKLDKLFVPGDFEGDGNQDTLIQYNYSRRTKSEIEFSADPFQNEWDSVEKWFYDQEADLYLTINKSNQDTLHLGTAQGLYCLMNIGDNNADGKDEIAIVIDYLDVSRVNNCKIYSLCKGKWALLKNFDVYEESFDFSGNEPPVFNEIKGFLENKNGRWYYMDYHQEYERQEDVGKMMPLKVDKCN